MLTGLSWPVLYQSKMWRMPLYQCGLGVKGFCYYGCGYAAVTRCFTWT